MSETVISRRRLELAAGLDHSFPQRKNSWPGSAKFPAPPAHGFCRKPLKGLRPSAL
jgi:hypothetical protein